MGYLDITGLKHLWEKVKEYVDSRESVSMEQVNDAIAEAISGAIKEAY